MNQTYLLEWLDSVVTLNLNPKKNDINKLTPLESKAIITKALHETEFIQTQFTIRVFSLNKEKHIKVLVKNYHSALINLWDQLVVINDKMYLERKDLKEVANTVLSSINELLNFIESRFTNYLSLDSRIPISYLITVHKKIKLRLDKLKSTLSFDQREKELADLVFNTLYTFINSKKQNKTTFREVLYIKCLVKELESLKYQVSEDPIHTGLMEILIYMNFNSKLFINLYTKTISNKINEFENTGDKMGWLLLYFKEFNQIPCNGELVLYPSHQNLKKILNDWFKQEVMFLEKKQLLPSPPVSDSKLVKKESSNTENKTDKVLCQLSTDQTALILRASEELKVLISKSMNHLFKTIVPFLSTSTKSSLSYDSMRSKAYSIEERDKEIAIETLERIISRIREY